MLRRFLIALCLLMPVAANAQSSKSTIVSTINSDFADNTSQAITAALLRTVTTTMVSSYVDWITCTNQGGMLYWNTTASPTCLTAGVSGQVLATYGTPAWENLATKLSAGSGITITGTITPTLAVSPNAVLDTYGTTQGGVLYRGANGWSFLSPGTSGQVLSTYGTPAWESLATKLTAGSGVIISGTITPTIATSASTILDTLGTAQGGVVYRGASGWAFLSPGTSGQVFTTGGAANNPSYTTVSGTGTVQSVSCGALTSCSVSPITVSGTISVSPGTVTGNAGSYVLSISPTVQTPILTGVVLQSIPNQFPIGGSVVGTGVNPNYEMFGSSAAASWGLFRYTTPGAAGPLFIMGSSRGSAPGTFSAVQSGDGLGSMLFAGDNGTDYTGNGATIRCNAAGNFSTTSLPGKCSIFTTSTNAVNAATGLTLDNNQHLLSTQSGTISATSCGTSPAFTSGSTDLAGELTLGTGTPTSCQVTFANSYSAKPFCNVTWQTNLASMQYTVAVTGISLVQTATSSNKVNYHCFGN